MQELLSNQWFNYTVLLLNAIVAGQILWIAINISVSKLLQYTIFTLGMSYAIAIGGIFKAPGFILNPEVEVFWLFINALFGLFIIYSFIRNSSVPSLASYASIVFALIGSVTVFSGILGKFMKYMEGIPVDRSKPGGLIKDLLRQMEDKKNGLIGLAPEGTRSKVGEWKTGFLRIAKELNSGVVLVSLDFLKKELVFGKEFMPTGDDKQDILSIKEYYNTFTPKNPANF